MDNDIAPLPPDDRLAYSFEEAARVCGVGRTKLYAARKDGLLRVRRFGGRSIILRSDLLDFLNNLPVE